MGGQRDTTGRAVADPRFSGARHEPRFQRLPSVRRKLRVDSRFGELFATGGRFAHKAASVDAYGRRTKRQEKPNDDLRRFYEIEVEDNAESSLGKRTDLPPRSRHGISTEEDEEYEEKVSCMKPSTQENDGIEKQHRRLDEASRMGFSSSDDEYETPKASTNDSDEDEEKEKIPEGVATNRIALVNLDWDNVRSVDLLVLLQSFVPMGGVVVSVAVYPSEIGRKQMAYEAIHGPTVQLDGSKIDDDDESDAENEIPEDEKLARLRKYELQRLRYYFAVATFDAVNTASHVYDSCDGLEFELSSNILDLRFVADDFSVPPDPRDEATSVPQDYVAPEFFTRALQHSNVELTWDRGDPNRTRFFERKLSQGEIDQLDFSTYLASEPSDEDDGVEDAKEADIARDKYAALLKDLTKSDADEKGEEDIIISFEPGLRQAGEQILEAIDSKNRRQEETVFEASQRRLKEKRADRRKQRKKSATHVDTVDDDAGAGVTVGNGAVSGFDDPFFNASYDIKAFDSIDIDAKKCKFKSLKQKKKKCDDNAEDKEEAAKARAELELLMMKDGGDTVTKDPAYSLKDLVRRHEEEASGRKKRRKKKNRDMETINETDDFNVDTNDLRFQAVFQDAKFAIDTTHPEFKNTAGMAQLMDARQKRRLAATEKVEVDARKRKLGIKHADESRTQNTDNFASLVSKLKRKKHNTNKITS